MKFFSCVVIGVFVLITSGSAIAQSGSRNSVPSFAPPPTRVVPQVPDSQSLAPPANPSLSGTRSLPDSSLAPDTPVLASPGVESNSVRETRTTDISFESSVAPFVPEPPQAQVAAGLIDPVFAISDPSSTRLVDHTPWDHFLSRYLVTDKACLNRICYARVTCNDRKRLHQYICELQSTDVRGLNSNEQLAFWLNLYNAKVVELALQNYPIRSIRLIKKDLFDFLGPFDDPGAVEVLGIQLSLNDIESGIVRPLFQDPRIHYGLNCASYGCPNLARTAWTADTIDHQLDQAAYRFINSGRAVKKGLGGLRVSKIYKWYADDFGGTDRAVIEHLCRYANPETRSMLRGKTTIAGYFYDWSLNDAKNSQPRLFEAIRL